MAWTIPKRWTVLSSIGTAEINQELNENMNLLKGTRSVFCINGLYAAGSNATGSLLAVPGVPLLSITKTMSAVDSDLLVTFQGGVYTSTAFASGDFDITINGIDHLFPRFAINEQNMWRGYMASLQIPGFAAGVHSAQLKWRAAGGTLNVDASTSYSVACYEVPKVAVV